MFYSSIIFGWCESKWRTRYRCFRRNRNEYFIDNTLLLTVCMYYYDCDFLIFFSRQNISLWAKISPLKTIADRYVFKFGGTVRENGINIYLEKKKWNTIIYFSKTTFG